MSASESNSSENPRVGEPSPLIVEPPPLLTEAASGTLGTETRTYIKELLGEALQTLSKKHDTVLSLLEDGPLRKLEAPAHVAHVISECSPGGPAKRVVAFGDTEDLVEATSSERYRKTCVKEQHHARFGEDLVTSCLSHNSGRGSSDMTVAPTLSSGAKLRPAKSLMVRSTTANFKGYQVASAWTDGVQHYADHRSRLGSKPSGDGESSGKSGKKMGATLSSGGVRQAKGKYKNLLLHPNGFTRGIWDALSAAIVTYEMFAIPFGLFQPSQTLFLQFMEWLARVFWSLDIGMSFSSGFIAMDGVIEMRPYTIARAYIRSWFFIDGGMVTIDWLEMFLSGSGLGLARVLRLLRMTRLIRLIKASAIISRHAEKFATDEMILVFDILKPFSLMILLGHLIACIWYAIGKESADSESWLDFYDLADMSLHYRYMISVRWSLSQFSGGMDEFVPQNFNEHVFAAAAWLCAWWFGTAIISILTSQLTHLYTMANLQSQRLKAINTYLEQQTVSKILCVRIIRNAQYSLRLKQKRVTEVSAGIAELVSPALLGELHFEMYYNLLYPHRFFTLLCRDNLHVLRKLCHQAIRQPASLPPGDTIFQSGDVAKDMVFVRAGLVKYSLKDEVITEDLESGQWVSEAALWTPWRRLGNLIVMDEAARWVHLEADEFQKLVNEFELFEFDPVEYAEAFVEGLNAQPEEDRSDLPFEFEWAFEEYLHDCSQRRTTSNHPDHSHSMFGGDRLASGWGKPVRLARDSVFNRSFAGGPTAFMSNLMPKRRDTKGARNRTTGASSISVISEADSQISAQRASLSMSFEAPAAVGNSIRPPNHVWRSSENLPHEDLCPILPLGEESGAFSSYVQPPKHGEASSEQRPGIVEGSSPIISSSDASAGGDDSSLPLAGSSKPPNRGGCSSDELPGLVEEL